MDYLSQWLNQVAKMGKKVRRVLNQPLDNEEEEDYSESESESEEEIEGAYSNPYNLPPLGLDKVQNDARIEAVEASIKAYPEVYYPNWGFHVVFAQFKTDEKNRQDWRDLQEDLASCIKDREIPTDEELQKAFNLLHEFIAKGDTPQNQMQRGFIVGVYNEKSTKWCDSHAWWHLPRVADVIGVRYDNCCFDRFERLFVANSSLFCAKFEFFETFLKGYGEFGIQGCRDSNWICIMLN